MSSYLDELERDLAARPNEPTKVADLLRVVRAQAQAFEEIVKHRDTLAETVGFVNALQQRLLLVDELPADAPFGALIRLRTGTGAQRAALYLGNGPSQPISKLVPVAV